MKRARERFADDFRARTLKEQVAAWQETQAITRYLDALEQEHPHRDETGKWIAWARQYVERLNCTRASPEMPEIPDPSSEDLKPFLGGLSPYGPSRW